MDTPLSEVRQKILEFIRHYVDDNDRPPTLEEIQKAMGLSSRGHVKHYVDDLIESQHIRKKPGSRGWEVVNDADTRRAHASVCVPIMGTIAAGVPIDAYQSPEEYYVTRDVAHLGDYVLRVKGTSMIEDHIEDGDLVVVQRQDDAQDGDIVVALLLDNPGDATGAATLKRFRERRTNTGQRERIWLEARNPAMKEPIEVNPDYFKIQGRVVAVIRNLTGKPA